MSDFIGNIPVPDVAPSGTFPLRTDYGYKKRTDQKIVRHQFGAANAKLTQAYFLGPGTVTHTITRKSVSPSERASLKSFFTSNYGTLGIFTLNAPKQDGTTQSVYCRFKDSTLNWEFISDYATSFTLELIEHPDQNAAPSYSVLETTTRFPSASLATDLSAAVQEVIPLVKVTPTKASYPSIYASDRRCYVGGQLYQARLLDFDNIQQSIEHDADDATFKFGNADDVMSRLSRDVRLMGATVEFSFYHVQSQRKLDLWKGYINSWTVSDGPEFSISASDGIYELSLVFPDRRITRLCMKDFNDGHKCPFAGQLYTTRQITYSDKHTETVNFSPSSTTCDKGWKTPNGCLAHGMEDYFGGINATPQSVRTKDNSTGTFGFGRSPLTSVSLIADSIYDQVLPIVYTDSEMAVPCKIVAGRDEGDFYTALGIVARGPITFGTGNSQLGTGNKLDGQYWHGYPRNNYGLRRGAGHDPVQDNDPDGASNAFSLGEGGSGTQYYNPDRAAGVAFLEIRRSDAKGLQLSTLAEHDMQAVVATGRKGWVWTAPGVRTNQVLTNPIWVALDFYLIALGLEDATASVCEQYFDVASAVSAAAICDTQVHSLIDNSMEVQWKFNGIIQEEKPLRQWLDEILMTCLGYYTHVFGKLYFGVRYNSSAVAAQSGLPAPAFTQGNIILGSLNFAPREPKFNHLVGHFGDKEYNFTANSVDVYDIDHKKLLKGRNGTPVTLKSEANFVGCPTKSQCGRAITTRLREELGGINEAQWTYANHPSFRTTLLSLDVIPGMICSISHPKAPDYPATTGTDFQAAQANYVEFRLTRWKLMKDLSIAMDGDSTHNDIYDLTVGPKPKDAAAEPVPTEPDFKPTGVNFGLDTDNKGNLIFKDFVCTSNYLTVQRALFTVYYFEEGSSAYTSITTSFSSSSTSSTYSGAAPEIGAYIRIEDEIMLVNDVTPTNEFSGSFTVTRAQLGTTAVAHTRVITNVASVTTPASNQIFYVGTGLKLYPGYAVIDPTGEPKRISTYDPATGKITFQIPYLSHVASVGDEYYADPVIYTYKAKTVSVPLQPRFFASTERERFTYSEHLPSCAIGAVVGQLETLLGEKSDPIYLSDFSPVYRHLRTLGNDRYDLILSQLNQGYFASVFEQVRLANSVMFSKIYAERRSPTIATSGGGGSTGGTGTGTTNLPTPGTVTVVKPANLTPCGQITFGGIPYLNNTVQITFGLADGSQGFYYATQRYGQWEPEGSLAIVIDDLVTFLQEDLWVSQNFKVELDQSNNLRINFTPIGGKIGTLGATFTGRWGSTSRSGITSPLAITSGRRYALAFVYEENPSQTYYSDLSDISDSTGISGGATQIELRNLPTFSSDTRVTHVYLYAYADGAGQESTPRFVDKLVIGSASTMVDTLSESQLATRALYPGASKPPSTDPPPPDGEPADGTITGETYINVTFDGNVVCQLKIPDGASTSQVVDGWAIGPQALGAIINSDVLNNALEEELSVVLR